MSFKVKGQNGLKRIKKWKDTVYDSLENAPKAFFGLFKGGKMGETLVKI